MIVGTGRPGERMSADQEYSEDQVSAYYLEVECLLERVEISSTHYQVLGLDSLATTGEIRLEYLRAAALLNPSQFGLNLSIPDASLLRVDQAFERISQAFAVLVNSNRRNQYDELLSQDWTAARPVIKSGSALSDILADPPPVTAPAEHSALNTNDTQTQQRVFTKPDGGAAETDRRKCERFRLSIPVLVTGYEQGKGKWKEFTQTIDISKMGVLLKIATRVRVGRVLYLTMPMPSELRTHSHDQPRYGVYALVRRIEPTRNGRRGVGLELLGEDPPAGYLEKPSDIFDPKRWDAVQRRRFPREERVEEITIDYLSQTMELLGQEETFSENVSSTGIRVMIEAAPDDFEFVRVRCSKRGFDSLAAVSNQYVGDDGVGRLCLRLLDRKWPV